MPFSGGKVPFAFVKNVVHIAFLTHGCCKAISVSLCGYLSVGQLNNEKWPTRNRVGARQMAKFARYSFAKTTANCSNSFCHFHLISSVSRPQRPFSLWLHLFFLPYPRRQHFRETKFFRCPFHSKSAPRNGAPPPPNFLMLPTPLITEQRRLLNWSMRF